MTTGQHQEGRAKEIMKYVVKNRICGIGRSMVPCWQCKQRMSERIVESPPSVVICRCCFFGLSVLCIFVILVYALGKMKKQVTKFCCFHLLTAC